MELATNNRQKNKLIPKATCSCPSAVIATCVGPSLGMSVQECFLFKPEHSVLGDWPHQVKSEYKALALVKCKLSLVGGPPREDMILFLGTFWCQAGRKGIEPHLHDRPGHRNWQNVPSKTQPPCSSKGSRCWLVIRSLVPPGAPDNMGRHAPLGSMLSAVLRRFSGEMGCLPADKWCVLDQSLGHLEFGVMSLHFAVSFFYKHRSQENE